MDVNDYLKNKLTFKLSDTTEAIDKLIIELQKLRNRDMKKCNAKTIAAQSIKIIEVEKQLSYLLTELCQHTKFK